MVEELLQNYRHLVRKVDLFRQQTENKYSVHFACKPGCDGCCRHLSLFPVEAVAIASALLSMPQAQTESLRRHARQSPREDACPLLMDQLCALYDARPLICRTHGLPVVIEQNGVRQVDTCPLNFKDVEILPGDSVLDLHRLNETLVAVNAVFVAQWAGSPFPERLSIAEALTLVVPE